MPSVTACSLSRVQQPTTIDDLNRPTVTLRYEIDTDGVLGHLSVISGAQSSSPNALPEIGDTYSYEGDTDTSIYAQSIQVESLEQNQKRYSAVVTYAPPPDGDVTFFTPNPILRDPVIWIDREAYTRLVDRDYQGKPIVNKCGVQFDTPYEEEDVRGVIVVEFNVLTLTEVMSYMRFLQRAVNSITWNFQGQLFPPRTVLAREVAASPPIVQGAYTYYHMTLRFAVANGDTSFGLPSQTTWDVPILERGYSRYVVDKVTNQIKTKKLKLTNGNEVDVKVAEKFADGEAHNLAADGTQLPDNTEGVFTFWRLKREVDFNLLPFSLA